MPSYRFLSSQRAHSYGLPAHRERNTVMLCMGGMSCPLFPVFLHYLGGVLGGVLASCRLYIVALLPSGVWRLLWRYLTTLAFRCHCVIRRMTPSPATSFGNGRGIATFWLLRCRGGYAASNLVACEFFGFFRSSSLVEVH